MPRELVRLTADQLAYIASASPDAKTVDIAKALRAPYFTVAHAVRRIRQNGWITRLNWSDCLVCGRPVCSSAATGRRKLHPECERSRLIDLARQYRKRPEHVKSSKYVDAWRKRNPQAAAQHRKQDLERVHELQKTWTAEQWAPLLARVHAADNRDYPITLELAENNRDKWMPDEDDYIMQHPGVPAREIALALGRTLWAVRSRRMRLNRQRRKEMLYE